MWGAEAVIDSTVQAFFALVLAWMLYRGEKRPWIFAIALLPAVMDMDHLLVTYSQGIKAFHSLFFVYTISGAFLLYGYLKNSETSKKLGITIFAVLIFSLSMDLLEGGKIAFMYPLSSQAYALPYFGSSQISKIGLITALMILTGGAYSYEVSITHITKAHGAHMSERIPRYRPYWSIQGIRSMDVGSERVLRVTALLTSLTIYLTMFIIISR